jgi:hypothetical protein
LNAWFVGRCHGSLVASRYRLPCQAALRSSAACELRCDLYNSATVGAMRLDSFSRVGVPLLFLVAAAAAAADGIRTRGAPAAPDLLQPNVRPKKVRVRRCRPASPVESRPRPKSTLVRTRRNGRVAPTRTLSIFLVQDYRSVSRKRGAPPCRQAGGIHGVNPMRAVPPRNEAGHLLTDVRGDLLRGIVLCACVYVKGGGGTTTPLPGWMDSFLCVDPNTPAEETVSETCCTFAKRGKPTTRPTTKKNASIAHKHTQIRTVPWTVLRNYGTSLVARRVETKQSTPKQPPNFH